MSTVQLFGLSVGLQFLAQATPEAPGLLFGLYESPGRIRTKARSIGLDIDRLLAFGALEILWRSPAENLPDQLGKRLFDAVSRCGAKRVFLDGVGAARHAFVFPERLQLFVNALNAAMRETETTSLYSLELPQLFMPEQITTDELSQMVENVVLTHYVRLRDRLERELLVLKIRDSEFDACPEIFHIADRGVRFGRGDSIRQRPDGAESAGEGAKDGHYPCRRGRDDHRALRQHGARGRRPFGDPRLQRRSRARGGACICADVILTDYMMPRMDGLTMIRTLREKGVARPVILTTAVAEGSVRGNPHPLHDGYLGKSYRGMALMKTVGQLLGQREPERE